MHPGILLIAAAALAQDAEREVTFARDVRPLLARKCLACHGPDEESRAADLRLDVRADAVRDRGGYAAIVPGAPEDSELWFRVTDDVDPMPPPDAGHGLEPDEVRVLRRWIADGAAYAPHWAFVPPTRPPVPDAASHPVDAFVRARLEAEGLVPSPPADRYTLLRRVSLDLTGLPPTPEEARAFAADERPDAYERAVDRLLASPHHGERWAAVWLDLARYADSAGHGSDPLRTIWRYRDWVIDAYDRNLPYDEFTLHQLAGDLLPEATTETRLATAFHRNTMTNTEGGTDDEEFRVLAVKDRVDTTMQVWMGLSAGCASCHSHKFDPLSQREYYQLFDFFNHTADSDRNDDRPRIPTPTPEQEAEYERLTAAIEELDREIEALPDPVTDEALERARREDAAWTRVALRRDVERSAQWGERLDGTLFARGEPRATDVLAGSLSELGTSTSCPTALRLTVDRGRTDHGNFVLTHAAVRARAAEPRPVEARFVRVELPGPERILSLAEVEVLSDGLDVALGAPSEQSSTSFGGPAGRATDGDTSGVFEQGSVTHTRTEDDPWWRTDLGRSFPIDGVRVWNRTDGDLEERLAGFVVVLLDDAGEEVWRSAAAPAPGPSLEVGPALGQPLRLTALGATFEQDGFPLRNAVDHDPDPTTGWAVSPRHGEPHEAVLGLPPLPPSAGPVTLELELRQEFGGRHTIESLRLDVTDAPEPPSAVPAAVRALLAADAPPTDARRRAPAVVEFFTRGDPARRALGERRDALAAERDGLDVVTTPVMVELEGDARRTSHVLHKGNFLAKGDVVEAATPAALHPFPPDAPRNRLGLARWILDDANPLTARVAVNRLWARLFGRGLVATEEDFGTQGALPTHPELLDWLAVEFREGGWDRKALLRLLVTSETYRQASAVRPTDRERDPDAALLARFPRQRLEAEGVRDVLLSVAGLLSLDKFGPSVYPPQPDGLWQAAFNGQRDWPTSTGSDRYRRGIYVFLRRTIPYPMLDAFDAPSRETCTLRRIQTNTPLQAFVTLNDPVFVEAAQALGRRMAAAGGDRAGIERGLWLALARPPRDAQVAELEALLADARASFAGDVEGARAFAADPLGPLPDGLAPSEAAAWTLVASTLLNLDAALTKE